MYTVRHATAADVPAIYALGKSVSEFSVSGETVTFWPLELLTRAVDSPDVVVLVSEDADVLIGFVITNYNHGLRKAHVENIFVAPSNRGQGVGEMLLAELFDALTALGCEYIATLTPPDAAAATSLYLRAGFTKGETFVWLDKALTDTFKKSLDAA